MFLMYVIGATAVLAFLDTLGIFGNLFHYLWASVIFVAAIAYLFHPFHKTNRLAGGLLAVAGVSEFLSISSSLTFLLYVWPAALVSLGLLLRKKRIDGFTPDWGYRQKQTRLVGGALVLSGVMRLITVISGINMGTVGWGWIFFLLFAFIVLALSKSPRPCSPT